MSRVSFAVWLGTTVLLLRLLVWRIPAFFEVWRRVAWVGALPVVLMALHAPWEQPYVAAAAIAGSYGFFCDGLPYLILGGGSREEYSAALAFGATVALTLMLIIGLVV